MRTVEIVGVTRSYGSTKVLDDVHLTARAGEQLALLGPSGSGKSTLLRLIAGLDHPDSGDIRFDSVSQLKLSPHERDVAMVFQQYALYPHLTVLGNISTGLRFGQKVPRAEAEQRARDVAGLVGIGHLLERRPKELSGGQRQRVALARAIARRSGTVLLDEPLSGLDAQLRLSVRAEIFERLRATGATVIHVTHDQSDALAGADRIAVIHEGTIRQLGTPMELYGTPDNLFVAQFLGVPRMNTFAVAAVDDRLGHTPFGLHETSSLASDAWIGVRPEHLVLGNARPWATTGTVVSTELNGPDHIVYLTVDSEIVALRHAGVQPRPGDNVALSCDPADVHVFAGAGAIRAGAGRIAPLTLDSPALATSAAAH
jgi:multiple sugar transport system ATP-binding protein